MGIPLYREPQTTSVDANAAASRSPIRRRARVIDESGRRRHHDNRRLSRVLENRSYWVIPNGREPDRARLVHTSERMRDVSRLHRLRRDNGSFNRRARNVERSLQAALENGYLDPSGSISRDTRHERSTTRSYFMPSPPYSNTSNQSGTSNDASRRHPRNRRLERQNDASHHLSQSSRYDRAGFEPRSEDPLPPLTRIPDRIPSPVDSSPVDFFMSIHDQLIRERALHHDHGSRSPAMSDSSSARDTWETLLTTVQPDENLPSVSSSFTSAEASANAARSTTSARSAQTTAPTHLRSFSSMHNAADHSLPLQSPCDPDESDTDSLPDLIPTDEHATLYPGRTLNEPLEGGISSTSSTTTTSDSDTDSNSDNAPEDQSEDQGEFERFMQSEFRGRHFDGDNNDAPSSIYGGRAQPPRHYRRQHPMTTSANYDGSRHFGGIAPPRLPGIENFIVDLGHPEDRLPGIENFIVNLGHPEEHEMNREQRLSDDQVRAIGSRSLQDPALQYMEQRNRETDADLRSMQRLVERLARRQDIPDDWWTAIGLERSIRESQGGAQRNTPTSAPDTEARA